MGDAADLDATFSALSDPTRRAILATLRAGSATVSELAEPFDMSLAAVSKHVQALERAGLVQREVEGRIHHISLEAEPLRAAADWVVEYRDFWRERLAALDLYLRERRGRKRKRR